MHGLSPKKMQMLTVVKTKIIHFAFDLPNNSDRIIRGLELYRKYNPHISVRNCIVYILTNYNTSHEQDIARLKAVEAVNMTPDIRIYRKSTAPQITRDLARWCNNRRIYRIVPDFMDYVPRKDGKTIREIYYQYKENRND